MEHIIVSRAILGLLILIHLFAGYASGISWGHINRKVLHGVIITELIAVTAYIIYDNLQTPPYDGWFLAIIGYIVVYGLILLTWAVYLIYTILDKAYLYSILEYIAKENINEICPLAPGCGCYSNNSVREYK